MVYKKIVDYTLTYWKKKLRNINEEDIVGLRSYNSHAWIRAVSRNIEPETVLYYLKHPDSLEKVLKSYKYKSTIELYFKHSSSRYLFVAVMLKRVNRKEKLIVKTTFYINKKVQRRLGDKRWK